MFIIFDLDDTLIETTACLKPTDFREALVTMQTVGAIFNDFEAVYSRLMEIDAASRTGKEALTTLCSELGIGDTIREQGIRRYYEHMSACGSVPLVPGAAETLPILAQEHTLALVSYGHQPTQLEKLEHSNLESDWFAEIVITDKYDKGDYYRDLLNKMSFDAGETLVVGDKPETDLWPARELGCQTAHIRRGRGANAPANSGDYEIRYIHELMPVVRRLVEAKV